MNSKQRLLTAWRFEEPDRVPIEMVLYPPARGLPGAERIEAFQRDEADLFSGVPGFDWGFMGLDAQRREEVLEDIPGAFRRVRTIMSTPAGTFTSIARYSYGDMDVNDCYWEKCFIETFDDFMSLIMAARERRPFDLEAYNRGCAAVGGRGAPQIDLFHPLGTLVRNSRMEEVYGWMLSEQRWFLEYLGRCTEQVCDSLMTLEGLPLADPPVFGTAALEMLIPPWLGMRHFDTLVFPFDRRVNDTVHRVGGRHRAHCHGNSGGFLERFVEMGLDGVEPLEPPPYGDNILADAKRRVGRELLLSGNIPTQDFHLDSFRPRDVRELVKRAIHEGAPGGGFTLRMTGGAVGNGKTREQCIKCINCCLEMIDAWREFGCV